MPRKSANPMESLLVSGALTPLRMLITLGVLIFGFLFAYDRVQKWVVDQVHVERMQIDTQHAAEQTTHDNMLKEHSARIEVLERGQNEMRTQLATIDLNVKVIREAIELHNK